MIQKKAPEFYNLQLCFYHFVQGKRKVKCDLVSLKVSDLYLNDDLSIANCMNSYFSLVFTVEDHENLPDLDYITDNPLGLTHITLHPKRMCSNVVISTGFISEYIILSRSTTMYMEVGPHHSSSQETEQKSYGELPPNITDLCCMQDCKAVVRTRVVDFWSENWKFQRIGNANSLLCSRMHEEGISRRWDKSILYIFDREPDEEEVATHNKERLRKILQGYAHDISGKVILKKLLLGKMK